MDGGGSAAVKGLILVIKGGYYQRAMRGPPIVLSRATSKKARGSFELQGGGKGEREERSTKVDGKKLASFAGPHFMVQIGKAVGVRLSLPTVGGRNCARRDHEGIKTVWHDKRIASSNQRNLVRGGEKWRWTRKERQKEAFSINSFRLKGG